MRKKYRFSAVISREGKWYVARCVEIPVTTQGETFEDARANLKEAIELYIESFGTKEIPRSLEERVWTTLDVAV